MKLKYIIKNPNNYLFANSLQDLALHYKVSLSGIKYKIKNKLINLESVENLELHHLLKKDIKYDINKYGIITVSNESFNNILKSEQENKINQIE